MTVYNQMTNARNGFTVTVLRLVTHLEWRLGFVIIAYIYMFNSLMINKIK